MPILDNVPFVLPGLAFDGTKLEQFAKIHNLVLRIETTFEEEIVVCLKHGKERRRRGGGALDDRVDEFHLIRTEAREFWDRDRGRETQQSPLIRDFSRRHFGPGYSRCVQVAVTRHESGRMEDYEDMFGPPRYCSPIRQISVELRHVVAYAIVCLGGRCFTAVLHTEKPVHPANNLS